MPVSTKAVCFRIVKWAHRNTMKSHLLLPRNMNNFNLWSLLHSLSRFQLPAKIWQKKKKEKRRKIKSRCFVFYQKSFICPYLVLSRKHHSSRNNKRDIFFICWFWAYQLFSQCRYSRKNYDTSLPPPLPNNQCLEPQLDASQQIQAKLPLFTVLWRLTYWTNYSRF